MPQDTKGTAMTFDEIRERLLNMHPTLPSRGALIDTLTLLAEMEADFHTLCLEVASLSIDHMSKSYATTPEFDRMLDRRGVVLPVL
jgi:hypothetical protein